MTDKRELDRLLGAFFIEGTDELADRVIDAALDQIDHTQQRRAIRMPGRLPNMTTPIRVATAAVIGLIAVGGGLYLIQPGRSAVGAPGPAPTPQVPATSGAAGGGSGAAHYEITGPDAASGDVTFARSAASGAASDEWGQSADFQDGSVVIRLKFPNPGCSSLMASNPQPNPNCGTVSISTATLTLRDGGWRALPLPGGPSCTWDTAALTANGGTGTVKCTNALNPAHPTTPDRVTVTFTYHDPSPGQL
jgi:hypothetical protein